MTVEKISQDPICYHFKIDDEIELFLSHIENDEWLVHDLLSYSKDKTLLYKFLKEALAYFDKNIEGHLNADIKDKRFLRLFYSIGFGITKIYVRRIKNEERNT